MPRQGDLVFVRSRRNFVGWLIRWATNGKVDHIAYYLGLDNDLILETVRKHGVIITRLDKYRDTKKYRTIISVVKTATEEDIKEITKRLIAQVGERYDHLQILSMLWRRLTGRLDKVTAIDARNLDVCSTLISEGFATRDIFFQDGIHMSNVSPRDIFRSLIVKIKETL